MWIGTYVLCIIVLYMQKIQPTFEKFNGNLLAKRS